MRLLAILASVFATLCALAAQREPGPFPAAKLLVDCDKNHYILAPEPCRDPVADPSTPAGAPAPCYDGKGACTPGSIAVSRKGQVFFTAQNIVYTLGPDGELVRVAGDGRPGFSGDGGPAVNARLALPGTEHHDYLESAAAYGALAFDARDRLYIGDTMNGAVRRIEHDGTIRTVQGNYGAGYYNGPLGIAIGSDQSLYVAGGPGLERLATEGAVSPLPAAGRWLQGIAIDSADNVYFLYYDLPGRCMVGALGPAGLRSCAYPDRGVRLLAPFSIAFDPAGNYFVADPYNHCIVKVEPRAPEAKPFAGACGSKGGGSGDGGLAVDASLKLPHGVAVDGQGNVYIADTGNQRIRKVDLNGVITTIARLPAR